MKTLPSRILPLLLALLSTPTLADTSTQTLYLSGHNKDDALPWSFSCTAGQQANTPSQIPVPSNWELHNFGIFSYGVEHRGSKTKPADPLTPVTGRYQTHFTFPPSFADRRIFLVFEGSMTDTTATINGKRAGPMHQGGYTRFKYEVTNLLNPPKEENTLDVTVTDESANDSVNQAERRGDYFNYGGIYRPVYLEAVPQAFIDQVAINATADGKYSVSFAIDGGTGDETFELNILDSGNMLVDHINLPMPKSPTTEAVQTRPSEMRPADTIQAIAGTVQVGGFQSHLAHPALWTAETPNLYAAEIRLLRNGQPLHTLRQRFGFRTIDPRPDGLYLNGQRILLKGADRHSFWPDSGRCLSEKISSDDIKLMHEMNMNAVRMSHYPPDSHFLDAADELGLYVLDELPGWHGHYDDAIGHQLVREMVTRDVNHPSILFWDNGNESGWNTHLDSDFPALDPQKRHVLHPWALNDGIDTKHYPDFKTLQAKVNGPNLYFPTEMLHGLYDGGAGAGLEDYWNTIMHGKAAGGGFIWAFLDEAPKRVDLDGHLDTRGNLAPDGIVGPYREKEASFYTIKQLWSPIKITSLVMRDGDFTPEYTARDRFTVENRYNFINLQDCKFSYELRNFHLPSEKESGFTVIQKGNFDKLKVRPGGVGVLQCDAPIQPGIADAVAVIAQDPAGNIVAEPVFSLALKPKYLELPNVHPAADGPMGSEKSATALTIRAIDTILKFDNVTGLLLSIDNRQQHFSLANGPRLVTGDSKLVSLEAHDTTVTATYSGDLKTVTWNVGENGWIELTASYHLTGPQPFTGLGFDYPEKNIKSLRYLGDGPFRVYANRTAGPTLSVWQNDYNDSITGSIPWKYPEFKGYFQNVRWAQYQTTEGPITFLLHDDHTYLQNFTPTQPDKSLAGKTLVPYPTTSIAFLHSIPPIGSKFSGPNSTGPAGQPAIATGDYTTHISLHFGEIPPSR